MRIPDEKIDEVRNAADIVDVIGATVRLKKRGRSYVGLCPFHPEKTPAPPYRKPLRQKSKIRRQKRKVRR